MLVPELRQRVYKANMDLPVHGLVKFTWGNVSAIDREKGLIVIKPSGVPYEELSPENMVVSDLEGNVVEGDLNPSSDLPTHVELYKAFAEVGGIVHTHSTEGVAWAQAGRDIPCYGTTHADTFYGAIPCARALTPEEINGAYEKETGKVIIEEFQKRSLDPMAVAGVTVRNHGPFSWEKTNKQLFITLSFLKRQLVWHVTQKASIQMSKKCHKRSKINIISVNMEKMPITDKKV